MFSRFFQNTANTVPALSESEVQQLESDLRREMMPIVEQQLKNELKSKVEQELKDAFISSGGVENLKETLREEILPSVREQVFAVLRSQLEPIIQSDLINELRNSETISNEREKVRIELKAELLQNLNYEIESLRKVKFQDLSNKIKFELDTLRVAKRNGVLLSHFKEEEVEQVRKIAIEEVKKQLESTLRIQLEPIVRFELMKRLRPEVYNNLAQSDSLNKRVLNELKESLRVQAKNELKEELEVVVKKEIFDSVTDQIRPEIEARIRAELTPSIIEAIAADNDNSLASLLQQAKMYLQEKLDRELTDRADKIARNLILNIAHEGKIEEGNVEALLSGLRDCAEANASPGGFSHTGFLKAEAKMACVRTGEVIEKGDFYIVIGGRPHSLPNSYGEAANLAKLAYYEEKKKFKKTNHQFIGDSDFRDSNNNPLQQDRSTHEISEDDLSI
jgi:hypothetical protein